MDPIVTSRGDNASMTALDTLALTAGPVTLHRAAEEDLPELAALLADDVLGREREAEDLAAYRRAFARIDADEAHLLLAARDARGGLLATMQLSLVPSLSRGGALRLQIEAVRVAAPARGGGLGSALMDWAHRGGGARGAALAQLTTDATRADAHRFYARLGYAPSHVGFKLPL
jgi:GNAT superfamily N-acetyltransferase